MTVETRGPLFPGDISNSGTAPHPTKEELRALDRAAVLSALGKCSQCLRALKSGAVNAAHAETREWYRLFQAKLEGALAHQKAWNRTDAAGVERDLRNMRGNDAFVACAKRILPRTVYLEIWKEAGHAQDNG